MSDGWKAWCAITGMLALLYACSPSLRPDVDNLKARVAKLEAAQPIQGAE